MKKVITLCVFSLLIFTGCHGVGGHVRVGGSYSHPHVVPPSHAPAYGKRSHYRYHYYPNANIYFDIGRNMYFYLDSRNQWSFSVNLPIHLRGHLHGGHVEIEMDSARPYSKHQYHKKKYKNYKFKNKQKNGYRPRDGGKERYNDDKREYRTKEKRHDKKNGKSHYNEQDERRNRGKRYE